MRLSVVAMLLVTILAGCIQGSDPAPSVDPGPEFPEGVLTFRGGVVGGADAPQQQAPLPPGQSFGVPRHIDTGFTGGEPNMGVTSSGAVFASAGSTIVRSLDRGETWEDVHTHSLMNSDPMMWVDPWTDCIYNVPMSVILLGSTLYESCDDGDTWGPLHSQNMGRGVYDHQKIATALPGPDAPVVAGLAHPTVFIICYNAIASTNCAMSYDGGRTWPHDAPVWDTARHPSCAGQQSHPTGAPDGTIVIAKAWVCEDPLVFVSRDSGLTWTMRTGPTGIGADTLDPEIAFTEDGAMYMLWQSRRGEDYAYLARSDDLGNTWAGPWNVTPPGVGSSVFASLHAGSPGRVAMAFHATNHTAYPSEAPDDARWYTYIVTTEDGHTDNPEGPLFTSYRVQDLDDPVQIGGICNGNQGCHGGNRNLLDFIDGGIGPDGTFYTVIADGCIEDCVGDPDAEPGDSRARAVYMTRLDGWSLFDAAGGEGEDDT